MKKEFNKGWFSEFYYLNLVLRAGLINRYEYIMRWNKEQKKQKIEVVKRG